MSDKFEALKAAALAATSGPWFSMEDDWRDGEDALITCESREGMTAIAKIDGGGSESGYDDPFKSEQQANSAFIAAANPAAILDLLAELKEVEQREDRYRQRWVDAVADLDAAGKRNAELERANAAQDDHINQQQDRIDTLDNRNGELGKHVGKLEKLLKGTEESLIASVDNVAELQQRLQQPIKLPDIRSEDYHETGWFQHMKYYRDVVRSIQVLEFKVEGE